MADIDTPYLGTTRASFLEALKTRYLPGIHQQFSSENLFYRIFDRTYEYVSGSIVQLSMAVRRSSGFGAIPREGRLPDPHQRGRALMEFPVRYLYGGFQISGPVMSASRDAAGAFASALNESIENLVEDCMHGMDRIFTADGSGRIAIITDVTDANVGRFAAREVFDLADQGRILPHVYDGDMVAIVDANAGGNPATVTFLDEATVGGIRHFIVVESDHAAKTFKLELLDAATGEGDGVDLDFSATAEEGDAVVRVVSARDRDAFASAALLERTNYHGGNDIGAGNVHPANGGQKEPMGMAGLCADVNPFYHYDALGASAATMDPDGMPGAPLQNVSVIHGYWRANVNDPLAGLRTLDDLMMQEAHDLMEEIGNARLEFILTSYGVRRAYKALAGADRRFDKTLDFDLGQRALDFNGAPLIAERYVSPGRLYLVDRAPLVIAMEDDWHWIEEDNSVLFRVPRYDKFGADLGTAFEFCTKRRNALAMIGSIREF